MDPSYTIRIPYDMCWTRCEGRWISPPTPPMTVITHPLHAPFPDTSQHNIKNVSRVLTLTSMEVVTFSLSHPLNHTSFRTASSSSSSSSSITIACRIPTAVYIREQVHPPQSPPTHLSLESHRRYENSQTILPV